MSGLVDAVLAQSIFDENQVGPMPLAEERPHGRLGSRPWPVHHGNVPLHRADAQRKHPVSSRCLSGSGSVQAGLMLPSAGAHGGSPALRCAPRISGSLWWYPPSSFTLAQWETMLVEQRVLGFDLLWLSHIQPAFKTKDGRAHVHGLMAICATLGFEVIIDTGSTSSWNGQRELERELQHCQETIDAVARHVGSHPAFFACYIPQEIVVTLDDLRADVEQRYSALVRRCKSASDKPVTRSPFEGSATPELSAKYQREPHVVFGEVMRLGAVVCGLEGQTLRAPEALAGEGNIKPSDSPLEGPPQQPAPWHVPRAK